MIRFFALLLMMLFLGTGLILPGTAVARSAPDSPGKTPVRIEAPSPDSPSFLQEKRRWEIYQVIRGGGPVEDEELSDHLWRVAGSLAALGWTPPTVTVEVIATEDVERG
ncbi:MAG: hypothetical protein QF819_06610 [Gemmatimonadota bacterium]|jgi:hypothetical protein|nr:hypothetical protein [Gemmatimonadota bacterium]MDP6461369.1 hypothetical protein [Gemmatimonadota bacterium]MDP6802830.1 hypothetical protein [Gemmatimonadota bacterium]